MLWINTPAGHTRVHSWAALVTAAPVATGFEAIVERLILGEYSKGT